MIRMPTYYLIINRCVLLFLLLIATTLLYGQSEHAAKPTAAELYQTARQLHSSNPEEALAVADKAAQLAVKERDVSTIGDAYYLMGYVYKNLDDIPNAFHYYFGAIRAYRRVSALNRVEELYGNLAFVAEAKGVHTIAEQLRRDRLKLEEAMDYQTQADMYYDMGLSLKHQGEVEDALAAQLRALSVLKRNPDLSDTLKYADIWLELGVLNYLQGKATDNIHFFDSALVCYGRAEHFNSGDAIHLSKVQNNRGNVHRLRGEYKKAKNFFFEALTTSQNTSRLNIHTYYNLGRVYYALDKKDSAIWAFTKSLEINIGDLNYTDLQELPQLNIELSKSTELFGSVQYLDSLGIKDLEIRGRAMRHVYKLAKERYEIINASNNSMIAQLYEKHREELASEARLSMVKTWGLGIMLALAVIAAIWFWWRRYYVRQYNRKLGAQMEKRLKDKYGIELKD